MSERKQTIDDMIFEDRNREYGSYRLRKRFHRRLLIGFLSSLLFILGITLAYFWYLSDAGDENIYMYTSSNSPYLKSAQGNLLSPEELADLVGAIPPESEKTTDIPVPKKAAPVQSFRVTENPADENVKPLDELIANDVNEDDLGVMVNDSTAFGGYLTGDGFGVGGMFDRIPEFPGGDVAKYVERNLRYPPMAIKQKIHGTVIVSFIISKTGHVTEVKVERGVNPIIDEEAVKTIRNMPPWKPALMHGKPINFLFRMPINFVPLS
ncbi:MAG TPA: TonB family protein [Bacteroidales bacterium]|jgi:protein TonB|nr:TonB family protein [Bacteroidales bacterium]